MKKLLLTTLVAAFALGYGFAAEAGVRFITDVPQNSVWGGRPSSSSTHTSGQSRCAAAGYTKTRDSCGRGKVPVGACPYSPKFFKDCCEPEYSHSKEYCYQKGKTPSRHSCGGMYACE